ncbi:MAG: hypothetical protein M1812_003980 [Candelaria pacifica]|nr:MAG: hypothetical protein M1812_003980 [Candelaria pacifica]
MSTKTITTSEKKSENQKEDLETTSNPPKIRTPIFISSIWIPRLILITLLTTTILLPSLYEPFLSKIYTYLLTSPIYTLSTFETLETVLCYALLEGIYNYKYLYQPYLHLTPPTTSTPSTPKPSPLRPPHKRLLELLTYITPLLILDLTLIKKYANVPLASIRSSGGYSPLLPHQQNTIIHLTFLSPTLHNFTTSSPLQTTRALPPTPPSSRRLTLELLLSLLIYDSLFSLTHFLFHHIPLLKNHHKPHHTHPTTNPQITNQLSILERLSLILLANFSLNIIGSHVFTRTLFVPVFLDLLIQIHCGLDLPWGYEKVLPQGWGVGARKHAEHHRTGEGGYEPFFMWWDRGLVWLRGVRNGDFGVGKVKKR